MRAELQRRGRTVKHKRFYLLRRVDNLLCLQERKFVVTTDSHHGLPVYPSLILALTLETALMLATLRRALAQRRPRPGLRPHSDRGVQHTRREYAQLLSNDDIQISMSRTGTPWDKAACEPFNKTLKYENVYQGTSTYGAEPSQFP
jgi:hypothetical protein